MQPKYWGVYRESPPLEVTFEALPGRGFVDEVVASHRI
jgi:hypothetical protein